MSKKLTMLDLQLIGVTAKIEELKNEKLKIDLLIKAYEDIRSDVMEEILETERI